jgi:DNA invertase Pin-like site-specific DNA recombinase
MQESISQRWEQHEPGQTTENQRRELKGVAARSGWQVVEFYEDAGISGSNGREKRPGLDRLLKDATALDPFLMMRISSASVICSMRAARSSSSAVW